jgi:S1-C subfamily serine protease
LAKSGAIIAEVVPGGPANRAGLRGTTQARGGRTQLGDAIVALDGQPIRSIGDLQRLLDRHKAGEQVRLEIVRDGQNQEVAVTLAVMH